VTGRALLILANDQVRARAKRWIDGLPEGTRFTFSGPKRTLAQNDALWSALTDIATQVAYHGQKLSPEDFKLIFMDALNREVRIVPNTEGTGFVNLGTSSSKLSKEEASGLLEIVYGWGAAHGVVFTVGEKE